MMGRTALKITLAVAMAAGLLLGVSGCGKSAEAEKQAPASKAGTEKVLRVGGEATYPPFLFKDEHGHYVGFEMDLIKAVAKEIGAEVAYTDMPFSRFMTAVENKKVDVVISAVEGTAERAEKAAFSDAVGHSLVDHLKEYAESRYTEDELTAGCQKYSYHAAPFTKESLLYREIFEKYYPDQAEMIDGFWMPNKSWEGCDVSDPSARVLSNYGESGM